MMKLPPTVSNLKTGWIQAVSTVCGEKRIHEVRFTFIPASSLGTLSKVWHREVKPKQSPALSKLRKQRSEFRDVEAARICGLGYSKRGNCTEKEPQKSEKSAMKPLVKYEALHTPRHGRKELLWICELDGNCRSF